jgi:hypothetical protein
MKYVVNSSMTLEFMSISSFANFGKDLEWGIKLGS